MNKDRFILLGTAPLTRDYKEQYEYVIATNEVSIASVKKLPRQGVWETEIIYSVDPVQDSPEEKPYYPKMLLVVNSESGFVFPVPFMGGPQGDPQDFLRDYVNAWKIQGIYPFVIRCRDERTYALLKDFCEKTNVKISIYDGEMIALDEARDAFYDELFETDDEDPEEFIEDTINMILSMSRDELKLLPNEVIEQIKFLTSFAALPYELETALKNKFKGL